MTTKDFAVDQDHEQKKQRKKKTTTLTPEQKKMAQEELSDQLNEYLAQTKKPQTPVREILLREKEKLEAISNNPLGEILSFIIKRHTGTEKELKMALTGLLYILRVLSREDGSGLLKVIGSSSAGKTNLVTTLLSCLPQEWVKEVGDISPNAIKYIQWKGEKILYIKEASGTEKTTEHLKLMDSGDGGFIACVTRGTPSEGFWTEEVKIPVKFIITTRAEGIFDPQLENRMFSLSIDESPEQTFNVLLHRCREYAGHLEDADFGIVQKYISTLNEFDRIIVPYSYEFLNILDQHQIRVRRDIDKILSLCQTSAFVNQHNRPRVEKDGEKILFCTPEDAYNVFVLSFPSFLETVTGLSNRLQRIYDVLNENKGKTYRDIAKEIGSYKMKVIRDIESLDNMGLVEIDTSSNTHKVKKIGEIEQLEKEFHNYKLKFLIYTGLEISHYMGEVTLPLKWKDIDYNIKCNIDRNKPKQKNSSYPENRNKNRNKSVTNEGIFYEKDELLKLFGNKNKIIVFHPCYGFVTLFVTLFSPYENVSFKYCNNVTNHHVTADVTLDFDVPECYDVTLPKKSKVDENGCLDDKIKALKEFILREKKALRKVWYDSLVSCFSESFISRCIEAGLLIKLPDGSYSWGDSNAV